MKHAVTSETDHETVVSRSGSQVIVVKQACIIKGSNCYLCNCVKHAVKSDTEDARHEFERKVSKQVYIIKGSYR